MKPRVATLDLLEHLATSHVCSTSCWLAPTLTTRCLPRIPQELYMEFESRESERRYAVTLSSIGEAVIATDEKSCW